MKKLACGFVLSCVLVALVGCAERRGTPVREAPLSPDKQEDLRRTLVEHTWGVEYVTQTRAGEDREEKKSQLKWTFEPDGTGRMTQTIAEDVPMVGGQKETGPIQWKLDGRNLIFTGRNDEQSFRVVTWSDQEMMWYLYEEDHYFILYPIE